MRRIGLLLTGGLLGMSLATIPVSAASPVPAGMVEINPSDINSWGFAAVVPVGGTLTWTNAGGQAHTATAADGSFDTGMVAPGASATVEFDNPGVFIYHCAPHPWMTGFVIVSPDATSAPNLAMVEASPTDINSWGFAYSVSAGDVISWANIGSQAHTATAPDGSFDTGLVQPGTSAAWEFDTPGLFPFQCSPHPWMKGNVLVN